MVLAGLALIAATAIGQAQPILEPLAVDEIAPGLELWALFAANGQPILLSEARDRALAGALENDLTTVAIH